MADITPNIGYQLHDEDEFFNVEHLNDVMRKTDNWAGAIPLDKIPYSNPAMPGVTNVQQGLDYVSENKADNASPNLTGVPTAPTANQTINNEQIATTEYVQQYTGGTLPPTAGFNSEVVYERDSTGRINLAGAIGRADQAFSHGAIIATLPIGYRPTKQMQLPVVLLKSADTTWFPGMIIVEMEGAIKVYFDTGAVANWIYMSLSFRG